jgi:hypothetical protein
VRRAFTSVFVLVAVFCLVLAALLRFYAPGKAKKTPLNLDIKLVATGPAKLLNAATGQVEDTTLNATRRVRTDSAASNGSVTVILETLCIVKAVGDVPECVDAQDSQGRLVSFTTDRVAADRQSAESVNDPRYQENVNGDQSIKHAGVTYKWPFDAKKQSYKFYDPVSLQAPVAKFVGAEKLEGLALYKYEAVIDNIDLDVTKGIPGKYSDDRTVWVDPVTGVIVKGVEHQVRTLTDGTTALDTTLTFDDASIKFQAGQAKDGRSKITQLTVVLPLIALVLGLLALVGAFLFGRERRSAPAHAPSTQARPDPTPQSTSR